jgi:hypothetical protein
MASNVTYVSEFNTDSVSISAPKVLESGAKQAYLNYNNGRLILQTATNMSVPFGLNVYDKAGPAEYSVELSFRGHETNAEIKEFLDKMQALDDFMIKQGVKNSKLWFKSDLKEEVVKAFYTKCVKFSADKEGNPLPYPPTLKMKLRKINNEFESKFFDVKGNPYKGVPIEDLLVKGVQVTALMECAGVWFAGSKFGLTWRAKQIVIHRLPERLPEFSAFRLGDAAKEESAGMPKRAAASAGAGSADNEIDDDEELAPPPKAKPSVVSAMMPAAPAPAPAPSAEEEEDEDHEPAPVPKKPVLKKKPVVAAKK